MDQRGYQDAAAVLPLRLRREAMALPEERQALAEELRLRVGRAMTVLLPEGEVPFAVTVEQEDLEGLCNIASDFSRYAAAESLRKGYLSVRGGCRVGLCGSAVLKEGETAGLRDFSSAAIRIPREKKGIGEPLASGLFREGRFRSALLLSPPGGGRPPFSGTLSAASRTASAVLGPGWSSPTSGGRWRSPAKAGPRWIWASGRTSWTAVPRPRPSPCCCAA